MLKNSQFTQCIGMLFTWAYFLNHKKIYYSNTLFCILVTCYHNFLMERFAQASCSYTRKTHYSDILMSTMSSQTNSVSIVYSTVQAYTKRKHQSSTSLAFVRGIHRWPVNSPHKGPVTWKMLPFDGRQTLWVSNLLPLVGGCKPPEIYCLVYWPKPF